MGCPRLDEFSEYRWRHLLAVSLGTHSLRCHRTLTRKVLTSAQSRECHGQAGGKDRSRLDAGAAWSLPPKARAGDRGFGSDGNSSGRSPRSPRTSGDPSTWTHATDNFRTIAPDRLEGWNPSKLRTCSIVISARTRSKSIPGMVVPHSVTRWRGARGPFRSVLSLGNGNGPRRMVSPDVANQRACGRAGRLAPATPAPRPTARS